MALNLYRRHGSNCSGGHAPNDRSYEADERRRSWKKCSCLIYASGTLARRFKRKNTERSSWDEAKTVVTAWEAANSWGGSTPPRAAPQTAAAPDITPKTPSMTIAEAADSFLANRVSRNIAVPTLSKYKTFIKQLRSYCESRGYLAMEQLSVTDMDRFYASWEDGIRAKAKKLDRLKSFIRFCVKRKWLTENIAEDLEAPEGSSMPANKAPFTDAELERILAACDALGCPTSPGPGHRQWGGEDVKDFILFSIYTGMRISDAASFDISRHQIHGPAHRLWRRSSPRERSANRNRTGLHRYHPGMIASR